MLVPRPSTLLVTFLSTRFLTARGPAPRLLSVVRRLVALLFVLNWRNWPLWWHVDLFSLVALLRFKLRVLRGGPERHLSIGQSPFKTVSLRNVTNGPHLCDWNMHVSNSSYARVLDKARFAWLLELVGPAMGREGVWCALAATAYSFHRELPASKASFDVHVALKSWDDKWVYYEARFVDPTDENVLYCTVLNKSCFKTRGSGLSIPPSAVLSISGLGSDDDNWKRATRLRKQKHALEWLRYRGVQVAKKAGKPVRRDVQRRDESWDVPFDGLEQYEQERLRNLERVGFLQQTDAWPAATT